MMNELALIAGKLVIAFTVATTLVLLLRKDVRERFGPTVAYRLWFLVPICLVAVMLPARTISVPATTAALPEATPALERDVERTVEFRTNTQLSGLGADAPQEAAASPAAPPPPAGIPLGTLPELTPSYPTQAAFRPEPRSPMGQPSPDPRAAPMPNPSSGAQSDEDLSLESLSSVSSNGAQQTVDRRGEARITTPVQPRTQLATVVDNQSNGAPNVTNTQDRMPQLWQLIAGLWLLGTIGVVALFAAQQTAFQRRIGTATPLKISGETVYQASSPKAGPALVGVRSPKVVVPSDFAERYCEIEQDLIITHERQHERRGDAQANAIASGLLCLFWFHPLAHLGLAAFRQDQELACDAAVIAARPGSKKRYAAAMLKDQLAGSPLPLGCHWYTANQLKERLTMLKARPVPAYQRWLGTGLLTSASALVGAVAWAAQPPTIVAEAPEPQEPTVLTGQLPAPQEAPVAPSFPALPVAGEERVYRVDGVKVEDAAAVITIIPESRDDYAISISGNGSAQLSERRNTLVIDGGLPERGKRCRYDTPQEVQNADNGLMITIRAPRSPDVSSGGNIFVEMQPSMNPDVSFHGCGEAIVMDVSGNLSFSVHGSMDAEVGDVVGNADISTHGSTDLIVGAIGGNADISAHGSTDIMVGNITGNLDSSMHGSTDIEFEGVAGNADVSVHGSGDAEFTTIGGRLDATVHGSGDLDIDKLSGDLDTSIHGSGGITITQITADRLNVSAHGSADLSIDEGTIKYAELSLRGGSDIEIDAMIDVAEVSNATNDVITLRANKVIVSDRQKHLVVNRAE